MPFRAAGHRTEGRFARRIGRSRTLPLIAVIVPLALASCVTPPPAPGSRGPERPGSSRPVVVVRVPPRPGSPADSAARADSIRAVERAEAERAAAARVAAQREEEVRVAAERAAVERAAAQRAAAERADSISAAGDRAAAQREDARRAEARRADSVRVANERAAAARAAPPPAATDRAAEERAARALLDSLRAAERATVRQLDSVRAAERAVAARAAVELAPVEQAPAPQAPAPQAPARQTPARQTPAQQTPAQQTPAQRAPAQPAPAERAAAAPTPAERAAADRQAAERDAAMTPAERDAAAERVARARAAERPAPAGRPAPALQTPRDPGVGIVDGPSYRLPGRHTFRFAGAPADERVEWTVLRYTREPDGEARERRVASERGEELELDLEAVAGGESRYLLTASAGPIADTAVVWAFTPDRLGSFTWRGDGHPDVRVWATVPRTLSRSTRLVVVMHGEARDAVASAVAWERWAAESDRVVIAPEFDAAQWPGERSYALGNLFASDEMSTLVPEAARTYGVVEEIARNVGEGLGVRDPSFDLWGHGAGAEFVHRFLLFRPRAPVRIAVAANADWYTLPNASLAFPAGVKSDALDLDRGDLVAWTRRMLVVMRGTADTLRTGLPARAAAESQGRNRFERAATFVESAKKIEPRVAWWLLDVPGAGHDAMEMAPAAQLLLERMP
jgi:hypothetical protein